MIYFIKPLPLLKLNYSKSFVSVTTVTRHTYDRTRLLFTHTTLKIVPIKYTISYYNIFYTKI